MLMDVTQRDGFGALLSYLKLKLQLDYSMDRSPIIYRFRGGAVKVVPMDWSFPIDPWKRYEIDFTKQPFLRGLIPDGGNIRGHDNIWR